MLNDKLDAFQALLTKKQLKGSISNTYSSMALIMKQVCFNVFIEL